MHAKRSGISLLEVLISMGILLIGLLGVAALIPAGRFEVLQGEKVDHSTMVGRSAFRDLKIRGFLIPGATTPFSNPPVYPSNWYDANNTAIWTYSPTNTTTPLLVWQYVGVPLTLTQINSNQVAVAIDPLGIFSPAALGAKFPAALSSPPLPPLARIYPSSQNPPLPFPPLPPYPPPSVPQLGSQVNNLPLADLVFRNNDDLVFSPNDTYFYDNAGNKIVVPYRGKDFPPNQQWFNDDVNKRTAKRASRGDYSWMATLVSDPTMSALVSKVTVSVAVFYKRDLSGSSPSETTANINSNSAISSGEVQLIPASPAPYNPNQWPSPTKAVRPGQWIMLAGFLPATINMRQLNYYRWCRVVAADIIDPAASTQYLTLQIADWKPLASNTQAWLIDNVITVYEKNMQLELP